MPAKGLHAAVLLLASILAVKARADTPTEAALKHASERGRQIFLLDEAGWVSTDEMLRKIPDPKGAGIAGWIVEPQADHLHTIFYRMKDDAALAAFVVDTKGRQVLASHIVEPSEGDRLSPVEALMVQARRNSARESMMRCTDGPMNTVVIPPASAQETVDVYVMSSQTKQGEYPLGGHQLFKVDPKGAVVFRRKFTNGCLSLSSTTPDGSKPVGLMLTHLLDTSPTEIHVFTSLAAGLPVFVSTPFTLPATPNAYRIWQVNGDAITSMKDVVH
jgi:hypothetical protein